MNFCSACGQRRSGHLAFCTSCGTPFPDAPGGEAPPPEPIPEPPGTWEPPGEPAGAWDPYDVPSAGTPAYPGEPPYPPAGDQPDTLLYDRLGRADAPAGPASQPGWGAGGPSGWGATEQRPGEGPGAEPFGEFFEPSYREGGRPPRPPDRRRRTTVVAVLAAVVVLGAAGGVAAWLAGRHPAGHATLPPPTASRSAGGTASTSAAPASSSAAGGTEQAELAGMAAQIQQSVAARRTVVAATGAVGACRMAPATGIGRMNQAIGQRQGVQQRLGSLPVGAIPGGQAMLADFQQVLKHSIMADQGFVGWMHDIQNAGTCPVPTATDAPYQAALRQSMLAVAAKQAFLKLWNPLAGQFGQPTFTDSQL